MMRRVFHTIPVLLLFAVFPGCEKLPPAPELPNVAPTASFYFTPVAPIIAGQTPVILSAVGSRDTDGRIVSYVWNFGDGTPEQTTAEPTVRHTFPDTSARCLSVTYGVLLLVVDDKGDRGAATEAVTVIELPMPSGLECR
jgi:hypothetical protein